MSQDPPAAPAVSPWRVAVVRAVARLPAPLRARAWRTRRAIARLRRRRLEARGDHSLSYPALGGMDRRLVERLGGRPGFYVEAGANDGYEQSNTYALERLHGWTGLLVEPVAELARAAARERPSARVVRAALVPTGFADAEVTLRYAGLMTIVSRDRDQPGHDSDWTSAAHAVAQEEPEHEFRAPARTLSSLLDEIGAPEVDLLSLDVEGYEAQVLAGLDLERHAPRWVLVEVGGDPEREAAVVAALGERYVEVERLSPFDVLFARRDVAG